MTATPGADGARIAALNAGAVRAIVRDALAEDRAGFDVTTMALIPPEQAGRGDFVFREAGVICGLGVAREVFTQLSPTLAFDADRHDGEFVEGGTRVARVSGPLAAMLSGERVALNLVQRMSGIATETRRYVEAAAAGGHARVVDTRKTTPGLRVLERYAVRVGGGHNHRNTLEDGVLIKDNHLAAAAARGLTIDDVVRVARAHAPHTMRIEVEVDTAEQAQAAIASGADVVLLDNMSPDEMRAIIDAAGEGACLFEASGGITLETIRAVAASGVDVISSGALTHSTPALDVALDLEVT
ncbi:MAG: carboxylating nicotinate-nucleotide diphosphorylase [Chloroflexi bacterium]|nr:carboxylating nicotinate-nucleotide diphosphorylase [Chloroflexota bacterium]MDA1002142.1 carboxylating nicotinate-nucleotide diphosphorylase [Chloroflexota bacterium]